LLKILALFPDLHDANPGGVQVSGQLAWEVLQRETDAQAVIAVDPLNVFSAAKAARFDPHLILFWHLDLLRIAPLIRSRAKRVLFLHGIEAWRDHNWLTQRMLKETRFLTNSHYTLERALPCIPTLRTRGAQVVHLGIGSSAPAIVPPIANPRAAVMIGRMDAGERYKGHDEVIRAWPLVRDAVPDAQLWIAGDGNLRAELESLVTELGLNAAIHFHGRVSEAEKEVLINAARCLVLPSGGEGFGLVYVEAMRAGRPCLVGVDAGPEVVNPPEAGLSADPGDRRALTNAIIRLLSDDAQWSRQSKAARERYETQFTAAHFQQRLLDALNRIH
jgi:phosphatidylinositol alpha-1,6-mannosyltransferase